jgi:NTE family protein
VDGGVIDPVPVGALHKFTDVDRVLAISVVPTFRDVDEGKCGLAASEDPPPGWFRRFGRSVNSNVNLMAKGNMIDTFRQGIRAAQIRLAHESCKRADLCLRPEHSYEPWHDYAGFRRFIDAGRKVATEHLDEIRALLRPDFRSHENTPFLSMVGHDVA